MILIALIGAKWFELGDSNARSTRTDTTWAGQPVHKLVIDNGTALVDYPPGNNPGVGLMPFVLGSESPCEVGWFVRRTANSATTSSIAGQWALGKQDVATLDDGPPDYVLLVLGVNNADNETEALNVLPDMQWLLTDIADTWPDAQRFVALEAVSDAKIAATHIYMPSVWVDLESLATFELAPAAIVDGRECKRVDSYHWSVTGTGPTPLYGGQECVADLWLESMWAP